jgi:nitrate reductase gamma subunit
MRQASLYFQVHATVALMLFAPWPSTRLAHAFGYLFRPYIVYRSREVAAKQEMVGSAPRRRGW